MRFPSRRIALARPIFRRAYLSQGIPHRAYLSWSLPLAGSSSLAGPLSQQLRGDQVMALARRVGNDYNNIHIEGGRTILGNVYGQSPDERALDAILDSLRYDGMTDRRDTLAEAQEGTFDWAFLEGKTKFLKRRRIDHQGDVQDDFRKVEMSFNSNGSWLAKALCSTLSGLGAIA